MVTKVTFNKSQTEVWRWRVYCEWSIVSGELSIVNMFWADWFVTFLHPHRSVQATFQHTVPPLTVSLLIYFRYLHFHRLQFNVSGTFNVSEIQLRKQASHLLTQWLFMELIHHLSSSTMKVLTLPSPLSLPLVSPAQIPSDITFSLRLSKVAISFLLARIVLLRSISGKPNLVRIL